MSVVCLMRKKDIYWLQREKNRQAQLRIAKSASFRELEKIPLGMRLRHAREAAHLSQGELARRCNVSQQAIARIEANEQSGNLRINTMQQIAAALECDFVYGLMPHEWSDTWSFFRKEIPKCTPHRLKKKRANA